MSLKLRKNGRIQKALSGEVFSFLSHATDAFARILPHTQVRKWEERDGEKEGAFWASSERRGISLSIRITKNGAIDRSLRGTLERVHIPKGVGNIPRTLDDSEHRICKTIIERISRSLKHVQDNITAVSLHTLKKSFDEQIVAEFVRARHGLALDPAAVFAALHELAEQTYENKSLSFGCLIEKGTSPSSNVAACPFPEQLLGLKKFRALSDGNCTGYRVTGNGQLLSFVDLDDFTRRDKPLSKKKFYPEWAKPMAAASRNGRCGICLTRNGDILVFDDGNLRFSYRFGRWQYWNHSHITDLMRNLTRVQRVRKALIGKVATAVYRVSLDASFRRNGALFVVLRNRKRLSQIVRYGDALGDNGRAESPFDDILKDARIQQLPRSVAVELASLDGALVTNNQGQLMAYSAVLSPKKTGGVSGTEGSRTKAAIGASHYGLAVKVSSDGDITVYHKGKKFLAI